jgi:glutathione S-transferase
MFAALNSVEPVIWDLIIARIIEGDKDWTAARLPGVEARLSSRLEELSARLGDSEWLDEEFSAGDLMMVSVLRPIGDSNLQAFPNLIDYVERGMARPAFKRAFESWKAGQTGETPAAFAQPQPEPEGEAA